MFDANFGRNLEYYDGFVFEMTTETGAQLATGGRYDALTRALGLGAATAAVGAVIRPAAVGEAA